MTERETAGQSDRPLGQFHFNDVPPIVPEITSRSRRQDGVQNVATDRFYDAIAAAAARLVC
jgi:hypothetical protein